MRTAAGVLLLGSVLISVVGCSSHPPGPPDLPTHKDLGGADPGALLSGRLVGSGSCLYLDDASDVQYLILWNHGVNFDGSSVVDESGRAAAHLGDQTVLDGGAYDGTNVAAVMDHMPTPPCPGNHFWMATEINPYGPGVMR
jgi:hypothetical protein